MLASRLPGLLRLLFELGLDLGHHAPNLGALFAPFVSITLGRDEPLRQLLVLLLLFGTGLLGLSGQFFELRADAVEKSANFRRLLACLVPRLLAGLEPFGELLALVAAFCRVHLLGELIVFDLETFEEPLELCRFVETSIAFALGGDDALCEVFAVALLIVAMLVGLLAYFSERGFDAFETAAECFGRVLFGKRNPLCPRVLLLKTSYPMSSKQPSSFSLACSMREKGVCMRGLNLSS